MSLVLPDSEGCSFCDDLSGRRECVWVVHEELASVEINLRQYELGGMLVIPRSHYESILEMPPAALAAVHQLAQRVAKAAVAAFGATGISVFQNNGVASGQSERHFHVHVVPRYPTSDPKRNFRSQDVPVISIEEQEKIASRIRAELR